MEQRLEGAPPSLAGTDDLINSALSKAVIAVQRVGAVLREQRGLLNGSVFAVKGAFGAPLEVIPSEEDPLAGKGGVLHQRARTWMLVRGRGEQGSLLV